MKTLKETVDRVSERLEDSDHEVWTRSELEDYIKEGYDALVQETKCLWDMTYEAENQPYCGTHVAEWEEAFMDESFIIGGVFNYTAGSGSSSPLNWEQQYIDNGVGPADHTCFWEHNEVYGVEYVTRDNILGTSELPADTLDVDRVTFNNYVISPVFSKDQGAHNRAYQYEGGTPLAYALDKDGFFTLRKIPIPSSKGDAYVFVDGDDNSATFGTVRTQSADEFEASASYQGSWGVFRSVPSHFPIGQWGTIRRVYRDTSNLRVEYFRFGHDLSTYSFEIPDRYVKYVELYAMAVAREREGDGQDTRIADHFMARFNEGVARLKRRGVLVKKERVARMGGGTPQNRWPGLARLPWPYPYVPNR